MPKCEKNTFCSRRCFKKDYYHRKKAEEAGKSKFPRFSCPECGQFITLDFDPHKKVEKWLTYKCPGCNTLMICVSDEIVLQEAEGTR